MTGPVTLDSRLGDVVGGRTTDALADAFEMRTVGDLLRHYPRRVAERGEMTPLSALQLDEHVTVQATVAEVKHIPAPRGPGPRRRVDRLQVLIADDRGASLQLVFFGKGTFRPGKELQVGRTGLFAGKVGRFNRVWQLAHPVYQLDDDERRRSVALDLTRSLVPIYPATATVTSWQIADAIDVALRVLADPPDPLSPELRDRLDLIALGAALHEIHQPETPAEHARARRRLAFDEALAVQLVLAQRRQAADENPARARPLRADGLLAAFDDRLPFRLTEGQRAVGDQLAAELATTHPMQRLLQGEVGSGKTVVALRAMLQTVDAGGQAALLAPTEVLAAQHHRSIETLLGPLGQAGRFGAADDVEPTRVSLLTGSQSTAARREALLDAASGAAGIVVGTHALIQSDVHFAELGLAVVDEQHRFGVEQREAIRTRPGGEGAPPHLLVMTATPIPRTVAMTVFGDLDTSTLTELPAGRAEISTVVVPLADRPTWLERVWTRIAEEVGAGRQAFVVCPRIGADEPDDDPDATDVDPDELGGAQPAAANTAAVLDVLSLLRDGPLAALRVAALHGRLPADEKDRVMAEFAAGRIDVLGATTMVEVGVDVPNATVMAVLSAERFGVSQLHQLRGRIGRGRHAGICLLVSDAPAGGKARERLDAVAATRDGFALAQLDVEQRREGDVLGAAQSGRRSQFKLLSLLRDEALIGQAREAAQRIVAADPSLSDHPLLAQRVAELVDTDRAEFLDKV